MGAANNDDVVESKKQAKKALKNASNDTQKDDKGRNGTTDS